MKFLQLCVEMALLIAFAGFLIFYPAARWDWPAGRLCLLLVGASWIGLGVALWLINPQLLQRRTRVGKGTPAWDLALLAGLQVGLITQLVLASFSGSDPTRGMWLFGFVLFMVGQVVVLLSMRTNPFFEATVRHQEDQGQRVVDTGLYARVRHPGYAGGLLYLASFSFFLGAPWSLLGFAMEVVVLTARIFLEEEFLKENLEGYVGYCQRVRYRLLPGVF